MTLMILATSPHELKVIVYMYVEDVSVRGLSRKKERMYIMYYYDIFPQHPSY